LKNSIQNTTFSTATALVLAMNLWTPSATHAAVKRPVSGRRTTTAPTQTRAQTAEPSLQRVASKTTSAATSVFSKKPGDSQSISKKPAGLPSRGNEPELDQNSRVSNPGKAAVKSTAGSSTATAPTVSSWRQRIGASFASTISGPSLSSFESLSTQNTILASYRLDGGWSTSAAFNFTYDAMAKNADVLDPFVAIQNFGLFKKGTYSAGAFFRVIAPMSAASRKAELLGRTRFGVAQEYGIGNSRWTLGLFTFIQSYFYRSTSAKGTNNLFFAEPSLSYQLRPSLAFSLVYDMDVRNFTGSDFLDLGGASTALMPTVSWSPNAWLRVEPSLYLTTGQRITWASTGANLSLSARLP